MSQRTIQIIALVATAAFFAAVVLSLTPGSSSRAVGIALLVAGASVIAFAKHPAISRATFLKIGRLPTLRPFTLVLWGAAVAMLGLFQVFGI
jgi:hypothetical protein